MLSELEGLSFKKLKCVFCRKLNIKADDKKRDRSSRFLIVSLTTIELCFAVLSFGLNH